MRARGALVNVLASKAVAKESSVARTFVSAHRVRTTRHGGALVSSVLAFIEIEAPAAVACEAFAA